MKTEPMIDALQNNSHTLTTVETKCYTVKAVMILEKKMPRHKAYENFRCAKTSAAFSLVAKILKIVIAIANPRKNLENSFTHPPLFPQC